MWLHCYILFENLIFLCQILRFVAVITERSAGVNSSLAYYKPSLAYRVLTGQGRLLLQMSFHWRVLSLNLLHHGLVDMSVDLLDSHPGCFVKLPRDQGARSAAAVNLLVKDLVDVLPPPSNRLHDDRLHRSNAKHQLVCRQVSSLLH